MLQRILLTALLAGGLAGLVAFGLQSWKVVPLILAAEIHEQAAKNHSHGVEQSSTGESWAPADGLARTTYTLLTTLLTGVGFAALLTGLIALSGREVGPHEGVQWGMAGFAAFTLAPALGLPPELPGMLAADLVARQTWWLATAAGTASGMALVVFPRQTWAKGIGIFLIMLPHLIGAPHGPSGGGIPADLIAHFIVASMVTTAVFWVVLGLACGAFYHRLSPR